MSDCRIQPSTTASGKGAFFLATDSAGTPSTITTLASPSEVQQLTLSGPTTGGTFALSFSGQTTGPIATHLGPPPVYAEWSVTVPSAGAWDVAINTVFGSPWSPAATYEVFDGASATPLVTAVLNTVTGAGNPAPFTDGTLSVNGSAIQWYPVASNVTVTGTTIRVRLSGPGQLGDNSINSLQTDYVRAVPHGGGSVVLKSSAGITLVNGPNGFYTWNANNDSRCIGPGYFTQGLGAGPQTLVDPALVRAALTGLSNVGSGNLTASGTGSSLGPVVLDFVGSLALAAQPLITCTDGAVHVTRVNAGGLWPVIHRKIHGAGTAIDIPLTNLFFGSGTTDSEGNSHAPAPYLAWVQSSFLQARPAATREAAGTFDNYLFTSNSNDIYNSDTDRSSGDWATLPNSGIGGSIASLAGYVQPGQPQSYLYIQTNAATYATSKANWAQPALKAGTYRFSFTRPHDPGLSNNTTVKVVNRAGATVATLTDDQTVALAGTADAGVTWHALPDLVIAPTGGAISDDLTLVLVNHSTSAPMIADAVKFERISTDDSLVFNADDIITYSAGHAWFTSAAGPAPAATNDPIFNIVGGILYPNPAAGATTMALGYNIPSLNYFSTTAVHANYLAMASVPDHFPVTADGYPSVANTATVEVEVNSGYGQIQGDGMLISPIPPGHKDVFWKGASAVALRGGTLVGSETTVSGYRKRTYDVGAAFQSYGVDLALVVTNSGAGTGGYTYAFDLSDAHVYDTAWNVDITNPPVYRPDVTSSKVAGTRTTRWLDPSGGIDGNPLTLADLNPPASLMNRSNQSPVRWIGGTVTRVENYAGSTLYNRAATVPLLLTFASGHNVPAGKSLQSYTIALAGTVNLSDGQSINLGDGGHYYGFLHYESPTQLVFAPGYNSSGSVTMTNVLTGSVGSATIAIGSNSRFGLRDYVAWCNQLYTSGGTLHLNVADSLGDQALADLGTYLAANLNAGLKVVLEYTNEPWNFSSPPFAILCLRGYQLGISGPTDFIPYYCLRSAQVRDLVRNAWVAAGRSGADLTLALNSQTAYPGRTGSYGQWCHDHDTQGRTAAQCAAASVAFVPIAIDEITYATYWSNRPSFTLNFPREAAYYPYQDMLDADQQIDFNEAFATYGGWENEAAVHRAQISGAAESSPGAADGPYKDVPFTGYEGGPETLLMFDGYGHTRVRGGVRSRQVQRHPRYFGICLHHLRMLEQQGLKRFNVFDFGSGNSGPQAYNYAAWSAYLGNQAAYAPGNSTQDAIQTGQWSRLDLVQSPMGGAVNRFMALAGPAAALGTSSLAPGATGTATASGFTGSSVTWTSSNTAVATVNAATGVYTAVAAGTCHFTATGVSDGTQTAVTANLTVATASAATSFTATLSPSTVAAGSTTTATVTPNGTFTGTVTGTPSGSAATGLSPVTLTFSGSSAAQTAAWTPTVSGTLTITWTNSSTLTNPSPGAVTVNAGSAATVVAGLRALRRILTS